MFSVIGRLSGQVYRRGDALEVTLNLRDHKNANEVDELTVMCLTDDMKATEKVLRGLRHGTGVIVDVTDIRMQMYCGGDRTDVTLSVDAIEITPLPDDVARSIGMAPYEDSPLVTIRDL